MAVLDHMAREACPTDLAKLNFGAGPQLPLGYLIPEDLFLQVGAR